MKLPASLTSGGTFVIDGGLSNVLEDQGCDLDHKLWTAHLLENNPDAIMKAHLSYLQAGAQCITTASYQAAIPGLIAAGYPREIAKEILLKSVSLAEAAIAVFLESRDEDSSPLIAASIGPYGAYLADGSEFTGNYGVSDEELAAFHEERIKLLDQSNADLLACETIPSLQEARVLSETLMEISKPAWISFSCKDGQHINDGSLIEDAVAIFKSHPSVFAIGVNCTKPSYISELIVRIRSTAPDKKIIAYPNSGEAYNAESKEWVGLSEPLSFAAMTEEWIKAGAEIVGGCCRIGPAQIKGISEAT